MPLKFAHDYLYPHVIPHHARFSANRVAVICGAESLTWAELEQHTSQVANALIAAGIRRGDKVCLFMNNSLLTFELFWGIIRSGAVVVALNTLVSGDTLARFIDNSGGKLLFVDEDALPIVEPVLGSLRDLRREQVIVAGASDGWCSAEEMIARADKAPVWVDVEPSDSINIVYTSGSTGAPKGIEHSHLARHSYTFGMGHWFGFSRESVTLLATPLYANGTWATMGPCMYRGGTCVIMEKFSAAGFAELVERHRCTHAFLVPTQTIQILSLPSLAQHDLSSFRVLYSAGQALMPKTFDEIGEKLRQAEIWEVYGMSEGFCTVIGPPDYARGKRGSVGKPMILDDIRIVDDRGRELPVGEIGEICGYSVGLMKGYYNDPAATEKAIWYGPDGRSYFRSGDLGRFDADGYLYICGRSKDIIKSGGINVFPTDIEAVFASHPAVSEVAVVGAPHEKWIETPVAFVIPRLGASTSAAELMEWANGRLGKFQRVSAVNVVPHLPRVTYGKVNKPALRAQLSQSIP